MDLEVPFMVVHKKASLSSVKTGTKRVSVSIDIYNQRSSSAYDVNLADDNWNLNLFDIVSGNTSKSWEKLDVHINSTPILPQDVLAESIPVKKLEWAKRLVGRFGPQVSVFSIIVPFLYLIATPSKGSKKKR